MLRLLTADVSATVAGRQPRLEGWRHAALWPGFPAPSQTRFPHEWWENRQIGENRGVADVWFGGRARKTRQSGLADRGQAQGGDGPTATCTTCLESFPVDGTRAMSAPRPKRARSLAEDPKPPDLVGGSANNGGYLLELRESKPSGCCLSIPPLGGHLV